MQTWIEGLPRYVIPHPFKNYMSKLLSPLKHFAPTSCSHSRIRLPILLVTICTVCQPTPISPPTAHDASNRSTTEIPYRTYLNPLTNKIPHRSAKVRMQANNSESFAPTRDIKTFVMSGGVRVIGFPFPSQAVRRRTSDIESLRRSLYKTGVLDSHL
jgi:hypothetical protein